MIENKGVELIAHFTDPPDERNYYYWNLTNGHMALIAEPHLNQDHLRHGGPPITCCEICYMEELRLTKNFTITNDFLFDGLTTRQVAARIPDNGIRFKRRYRIKVNQFAVSESAYRFLQLVRQQLDIQGSVFDPPPANIRGNIINLDAPERQALGYFFVVEPSSSDMIYINRSDIPPEYRGSQQIIADDCRVYESIYGERPTLYPPDDWEYN